MRPFAYLSYTNTCGVAANVEELVVDRDVPEPLLLRGIGDRALRFHVAAYVVAIAGNVRVSACVRVDDPHAVGESRATAVAF